jgi:serine protease Do
MRNLNLGGHPQKAILASALALGLTGLGLAAVDHLRSENSPVAVRLADPNEPASRAGFASVVEKVAPAVVNISSTKVVKAPTGYFQNESMQQGDDDQQSDDPSDMLRQFFGGNPFGNMGNGRNRGGNMMPREQREQGLGSGVIVSPDGYILTNNHVVDGATDIRVALADKREFKAKVIGTDPKVDIAVLKIDASNLPAIVFGDSNRARVGDYAIAVGDPFGVGQTVTMGIVSAKGRTGLGIEQYEDFIQTDAPINPGNSGGALINDRGELIGINTAILAHGSEGNQGIGFAIPANLARTVMDQIVKYGKVQRAYLGIIPQDVTPAIAEAFGQKTLQGALVGDVTADGPAQKAGLRKGDIVLEVNGKTVANANDLRMTVSMMQPGTSVQLKVVRDGAIRDFTAQLGDLPGTQATNREQGSNHSDSALAGVSVDNLDPQTARELHLPANTPGVVVTNISPSSPAADSGLQRGDVIQEVNRKPVTNTSEFEQAVRASKHDPLLLVNRQGNTMYVVG